MTTDHTPPADRAALRDRIAAAVREESSRVDDIAIADAVLAVLPPPVSRADVLREAADLYAKLADQNEAYELADHGSIDHESRLQYEAVRDVVAGLRRMADEAQPGAEAAS